MGAVQAASAQVGGFQVGGDAVAVQGRVVGAQQRAAAALALPVRADGQHGQVMVSEPGRVADLQRLVEGPEPVDPGAGDGGEPLVVVLGRGRWCLAGGQPQGHGVLAGGGTDDPVGQGMLHGEAEIVREDAVPVGGVGDQPPGDRQVSEGIGDDLAQDPGAGAVRDDHGRGCVRQEGGHDSIPCLKEACWPVAAWAPSPMVAYTCGRRTLSTSPQPSPATATAA